MGIKIFFLAIGPQPAAEFPFQGGTAGQGVFYKIL